MQPLKLRSEKIPEEERINIRLEGGLKEALKAYCTEHRQKMSRVIREAVKAYIGYKE